MKIFQYKSRLNSVEKDDTNLHLKFRTLTVVKGLEFFDSLQSPTLYIENPNEQKKGKSFEIIILWILIYK